MQGRGWHDEYAQAGQSLPDGNCELASEELTPHPLPLGERAPRFNLRSKNSEPTWLWAVESVTQAQERARPANYRDGLSQGA